MKRILLKLQVNGNHVLLPYDYEYNIGASLYRALREVNQKINESLHEKGSYKGFTYSRLIFKTPFKTYSNGILIESRKAELILSVYDEQLYPLFRQALLKKVNDFYCGLSFTITDMIELDKPLLGETMRFKSISPIFLKYSSKHLNPLSDIDLYSECFVRNLNRKKEGVNHGWIDFEYNFKLLSTPKKAGITVKKNGETPSHLICYEYEFEITAPLELIEIGYYHGFGSNNSMGMGCVKILE